MSARCIGCAFERFHAENPAIYEELRELAFFYRRRGRAYYSIDGLFQIVRHHRNIRTTDTTTDFKLNDHYRALYARLLMRREPALEDFFRIRERRTVCNCRTPFRSALPGASSETHWVTAP